MLLFLGLPQKAKDPCFFSEPFVQTRTICNSFPDLPSKHADSLRSDESVPACQQIFYTFFRKPQCFFLVINVRYHKYKHIDL